MDKDCPLLLLPASCRELCVSKFIRKFHSCHRPWSSLWKICLLCSQASLGTHRPCCVMAACAKKERMALAPTPLPYFVTQNLKQTFFCPGLHKVPNDTISVKLQPAGRSPRETQSEPLNWVSHSCFLTSSRGLFVLFVYLHFLDSDLNQIFPSQPVTKWKSPWISVNATWYWWQLGVRAILISCQVKLEKYPFTLIKKHQPLEGDMCTLVYIKRLA